MIRIISIGEMEEVLKFAKAAAREFARDEEKEVFVEDTVGGDLKRVAIADREYEGVRVVLAERSMDFPGAIRTALEGKS